MKCIKATGCVPVPFSNLNTEKVASGGLTQKARGQGILHLAGAVRRHMGSVICSWHGAVRITEDMGIVRGAGSVRWYCGHGDVALSGAGAVRRQVEIPDMALNCNAGAYERQS